jgi:hypothetical protein
MNPVDATKYKITDTGIYYVDSYYPYHGGQNPNWNAFSGKILDLKDGVKKGVDYFLPLLATGIYDSDYTIAIVPSSDPAKQNTHGTKLLIDTFYKGYAVKNIQNGSACLIRHIKVAKSATGDRSVEKHLGSINLKNKTLVKNRVVLLVDDVTTTGNSLVACTQILMEGDCKKVIHLAMAKTA